MESSAEIKDTGTIKEQSNYSIVKNVVDFKQEDNLLLLITEQKNIILEFITSDIIRVVMKQSEKSDLSTSPAVIDHGQQYEDFAVVETATTVEVTTDSLELVINKHQFAINFYNSAGELINGDCENKALGWNDQQVRAWKEIKPDERFYGLGEKTGWLDKRGNEYVMWNEDVFEPHVESSDPLYQSIPFLLGFNHGQAYGLYFDNTYKTHFDLGKEEKNISSFWAAGGKLDYYFINGPQMKDVISNYTTLTGRMPLPPKWSLGYHQSRYSYYPEQEVRDLATTFRDKEIPCDGLHFDIHYMDDHKVFTWDKDRFPNPKKLLTDLNEKGFKPITIIDPGVKKDPCYEVYQDGIKNDCFCKYLDGQLFTGDVWPGECVFPDFAQSQVRNWWGDLHQQLVDDGVQGIWNDMNEPAVFNEEDGNTMNLDVVHDHQGEISTHRRFHNIYALLENQATYHGLKKHLSNQRPFLLTRAGFAGIQRYAAVWTGDNRSFWDHLDLAMPMLMNMGLSGLAFSGVDIGGFTGDTSGELLARWTQLGAFIPFFRNHCEVRASRQEPWSFEDYYEEIIADYINLRYRFLTHLYNLFYQTSQTGLPVMRPLVLEYPEDEETYNLTDQFMIGESILVAPIYAPDRDKRMVYFPPGEWYDFWTGEKYEGQQYLIVDAPLDTLPLYIKAGSILPLIPALNYVGERAIEELEVNIYPSSEGSESSYTLYEDDGISFDYQTGESSLIEFNYQQQDDEINLSINYLKIGYQLEYQSYKFKINELNNSPQEVLVDGESIKDWVYRNNNLEITVPINIKQIEIKLLH